MFEHSATIASGRTSRPAAVSISALGQIGIIAAALTVSVWRIEPMPPVHITTPRFPIPHVKVFTPERIASAAPVSANALKSPRVLMPAPFVAPTRMPARAAVIFDDAPPSGAPVASDAIGTPGVLALGQPASFVAPRPADPPSPAPPPKTVVQLRGPVPVGGKVRPPVMIHAPKPQYPDLARKARVSGLVRLSSIIGTDGKVRALELVSGHPLLVNAALDAVRQWVYQPTLLNGEPVEVILMIDVNFSLAQ